MAACSSSAHGELIYTRGRATGDYIICLCSEVPGLEVESVGNWKITVLKLCKFPVGFQQEFLYAQPPTHPHRPSIPNSHSTSNSLTAEQENNNMNRQLWIVLVRWNLIRLIYFPSTSKASLWQRIHIGLNNKSSSQLSHSRARGNSINWDRTSQWGINGRQLMRKRNPSRTSGIYCRQTLAALAMLNAFCLIIIAQRYACSCLLNMKEYVPFYRY